MGRRVKAVIASEGGGGKLHIKVYVFESNAEVPVGEGRRPSTFVHGM